MQRVVFVIRGTSPYLMGCVQGSRRIWILRGRIFLVTGLLAMLGLSGYWQVA